MDRRPSQGGMAEVTGARQMTGHKKPRHDPCQRAKRLLERLKGSAR